MESVEHTNSKAFSKDQTNHLISGASDPKILIGNAISPVVSDLQSLEGQLTELLEVKTHTGSFVIEHVFSGNGKRVRPALFFMSSKLVGYSGSHLTPIAAVCEYVHAASLLHDDVIDSSTIRRGKPSANTIWGDEAAVLVGDLIYSRASELMAMTGSLEIVSMFARAIRLMSEGELFQLEHIFNAQITEESYFKIIDYKTAELLGAACRAAAVLNHSSKEICDALEAFGRSVGYAFQLTDDALDYSGSTPIFGKQTLSDLPDGKVTLPIILLRNYATPGEWALVESIIQNESISSDHMMTILELVHQYDTIGKTLERAGLWTQKALDCLSIFPDSEARSHLENLAKSLILRFN